MQLVCGTVRLQEKDRVLLVCSKEGMPFDDLQLQLLREEDKEELRRRWSEVPGLMEERIYQKWPPLHQAVHAGDLVEIRRLLEERADPNGTTSYLSGVSAYDL